MFQDSELNTDQNDILIILNHSHSPLELYNDKYNNVKELFREETKELSDISLAIYKSRNSTRIIAHTRCRLPEDKTKTSEDARLNRYYFLYHTKKTSNLIDIFECFIAKIRNENIAKIDQDKKENYEILIVDEEDTHFLFRDLLKVISKKSPNCDESIITPLEFNSRSIEEVIPSLIKNFDNYNHLKFLIYTKLKKENDKGQTFEKLDINIYTGENLEKGINIENFEQDADLQSNKPLSEYEVLQSETLIGHINEANNNISNQNILKKQINPVTLEGKTLNSGRGTKGIIGSFLALITIAFLFINSRGWILEILFGIISLVFAVSFFKNVSYCKECNEIFDFELKSCPACSSVLTKDTIEEVNKKLKMEGKSKQKTDGMIDALQKLSKETPIKPVTIEGKTVNYGRETDFIIGFFLASVSIQVVPILVPSSELSNILLILCWYDQPYIRQIDRATMTIPSFQKMINTHNTKDKFSRF